jgi:hypothetical protein
MERGPLSPSAIGTVIGVYLLGAFIAGVCTMAFVAWLTGLI